MFSTPIEKCNESPLHGWATIYFSTAVAGDRLGHQHSKKTSLQVMQLQYILLIHRVKTAPRRV